MPSTQSSAALIQFLTKTKEGYCQQFAFGMAVLARLAGIPARVVVGYTQGSFIGNDNWQVKTSDAHAWPELYFPGDGWLRFEPTPPNAAGLAGQATAIAPPYSTPLADQPIINPATGQRGQHQPQPGVDAGEQEPVGPEQAEEDRPRRRGRRRGPRTAAPRPSCPCSSHCSR